MIDLSDPAHIEASLLNSHNRNRLNVLRRLGDVRLEIIDSVEGLLAVIDEIAVCDLRQGAINGALPFTYDPLERRLHVELMQGACSGSRSCGSVSRSRPQTWT